MNNQIIYCRHPLAGLAMAERMAAEVLGSEYKESPDYHVLSFGGGGADEVRAMLTTCDVMPDVQHVVVVPNASKLSDSAQSALLKTLEEKGVLFLLIAKTSLLRTVESRCEVTVYRPASLSHFVDQRGNEQGTFLYLATGGYREAMDAVDETDTFSVLYTLYQAFLNGDKKEALKCLGLLKEKDPEFFPTMYPDEVETLREFLLAVVALQAEKKTLNLRTTGLTEISKRILEANMKQQNELLMLVLSLFAKEGAEDGRTII